MANGLNTTWHRIRALLGGAPEVGAADTALLARFLGERDECAFAELMRRHSPMVRGVCARVLGNPHDVEDAFQATFLILSHKASSIHKRESLSCWLHGVALRVAVRLKQNIRRRKEQPLPPDVGPQAASDDVSWGEVRSLIDAELARLPESYRQPLILCYLEGKTRDEAARELGWTLTTFRGRLERGRERLRRRLERRGLALSAGLLATLAVPSLSTASAVSSQAAALAAEVMRAMFLSKVKTLALWCVAILFLGAGGAATVYHGVPAGAAPPPEAVGPPKPNKPPRPPEDDGLVRDYKAHLDTFHLSLTLKPQEEKDKFNTKYELRNVQLHVADVRVEPPAKGPTGKPISANARITKDQAAKIIGVLAKDDFFRDSVADAERLSPRPGSHFEMWAGYHKPGAAAPVQRWRTLDWNLHMVEQLDAIRGCVDGEAVKLLDQMLKSLEEERKEWERTEVFTIKTVDDLDAITGESGPAGKKVRRVALDGVLPFAVWPRDLTDEQKKLRDEGLQRAKKLLQGQAVYYYPTRPAERGDMVRYIFGPTKIDLEWTGQTPAEQTTWGGFAIGVLLIQEGYSPWVQRGVPAWDDKTRQAFSAAQQYAIENQKGIWKYRKLADRLLAIAGVRTGVEREWGLGPIREWREITPAQNDKDLLDRGGIAALFLSPDGKTVMAGGDLGGIVQLREAFTLKMLRDVYREKRELRALGFTDDNQPWMLWTDAGPTPVEGKTYHLVNAATDKERCSFVLPRPIRLTALSPNGKYLAISEERNTKRVVLMDAQTGKWIANLGEHNNVIERLAFSRDGKALASGSAHTATESGEIKVWDVASRKEKAACRITGGCTGLQFTGDGKRLFAAVNREQKHRTSPRVGGMVWFDAGTLKEQGRQDGPTQPEKPWVQAFAATPDGKTLVVAWWEYREYKHQRFPVRNVRVYDLDSGKEVVAPAVHQVVDLLTFSSDGRFLLTGGDQLNVALWEALRR